MLALGCAAPGPAAGDSGTDAPATFVALVPGEARPVTPPSDERQTHPSLAADPAGGAWVAWDVGEGEAQRAELARLDGDGAVDGAIEVLSSAAAAGFTTPDLAVDEGGDLFVVLRVADRVLALRHGATAPVAIGEGDLGFWTAPDLAPTADGLVVGWWEGALDPGSPASYHLARVDRDLRPVAGPDLAASSPDTGSPLALERLSDGGFVLAWSERAGDGTGAIRAARFDADGIEVARVRVDDLPLPHPPSRPALAAEGEVVAIGWRAQDDAQVGAGTRLRRFDLALAPLGPSIALGLAPEATNRVELSAAEGHLAATWEEATAEGDVVLQLFDLRDGRPLTGPVRVHDALEGRQARPTVEVAGGRVWVAWESGPAEGPAIVVRRFDIASGA